MKTTMNWKQADLIIQALALAVPMLWVILSGGKNSDYLFVCYFTVGGAQVVSCIANKVWLAYHLRHRGRTAYEIMLVVIAVVTCLVFIPMFNALFFFLLYGLLFTSPFMAIWYATMCWRELKTVNKYVYQQDREIDTAA